MSAVIRLRRGGRTRAPRYRVVIVDSRTRTRGPVIDEIGVYHPCEGPVPYSTIDVEKARLWLSRGARVSETVRNIFAKEGLFEAASPVKQPKEA
jgi:small subunit ribosomal protein S16